MTAIEMRAVLLNDIDNLIQDESVFTRLKKYVARLKKECPSSEEIKVRTDLVEMCAQVSSAKTGSLKGRSFDDFISEL